ncbi:unnamed protein product [Oreochromis niloticus]|nr:unnamed protein product [Mustela putorius furo]
MSYVRLLLFLPLASVSAVLQLGLQAKLGADVTLQCQIITDERISVLKWSKADLNTDGYVYFYRHKRFYENYQHPSFHGRVKLRDPEMKDGDVSLILKNVTFNDAGMYECHVAVRNPVTSKRVHTEISHFINLTVTEAFIRPGNMLDGHVTCRLLPDEGAIFIESSWEEEPAGFPNPAPHFALVSVLVFLLRVHPAELVYIRHLKLANRGPLAAHITTTCGPRIDV